MAGIFWLLLAQLVLDISVGLWIWGHGERHRRQYGPMVKGTDMRL